MRGVVLAGGEGNRLKSISDFKPLTSVNGQPMINYPLNTLERMGCDSAVITTNYTGLTRLPLELTSTLELDYARQSEPKGMADALDKTRVEDIFPVIAGDFYFDPAPVMQDKPTLFYSRTDNPSQFGIYNPQTNRIVEKPVDDIGNMAILAVYIYDQQVWEGIKTLTPSARGELEITDLNNWYLDYGIQLIEYVGFWGDMGTPEGLNRVAEYIRLRDPVNV